MIVKLLKDEFKLPRIQSPNRRSTPLMGNNNFENPPTRQNISSIMNTPVPSINIRQIKKRTKKPREIRDNLSTSRVIFLNDFYFKTLKKLTFYCLRELNHD